MVYIKYFCKLHATYKLNFATYKLNALKINPIFGGISFINALGESIRKVFQQFLHACKIILDKLLHNNLVLES